MKYTNRKNYGNCEIKKNRNYCSDNINNTYSACFSIFFISTVTFISKIFELWSVNTNYSNINSKYSKGSFTLAWLGLSVREVMSFDMV